MTRTDAAKKMKARKVMGGGAGYWTDIWGAAHCGWWKDATLGVWIAKNHTTGESVMFEKMREAREQAAAWYFGLEA